MRTAVRRRTSPLLIILIILFIAAASGLLIKFLIHEEPPDPHEGQVYLYDGMDWIWMTPLEGVEPNSLTADNFSIVNGQPVYIGQDYDVLLGVDVSEHQHDIDWKLVASSGVDFAMIRIGYRGYTEGGLYEDPMYRSNLEGSLSNKMAAGVYFFSQAINVQEAIEEAEYVLELLDGYDITMPVVFDWERIDDDTARTDNIDTETLTNCAIAFCQTVKNAGYEPCVYFNRRLGYYGYDLSRLTDYKFWFALPESPFPNFYYASDMWQYSFTEMIPGISEETDMNLFFLPRVLETDISENES